MPTLVIALALAEPKVLPVSGRRTHRGLPWYGLGRARFRERARLDECERLHVGLATRESREIERRGVHRHGTAVHEHLGHELAGDRTVHETVAVERAIHRAPALAAAELMRGGDGTHDARLIRAHLVESGPGAHELGVRQRRRPMNRALDHPRLEAPIDLGVEAVRLVATAVTQEQAGSLAAEREVSMW